MNAQYGKNTSYFSYKHIQPWAPPRSDYNDTTGQWKKAELPDNEIDNFHEEELRMIQINIPDEDDERNVESFIYKYFKGVESINVGVEGMILLLYKKIDDAIMIVESDGKQVQINNKAYTISRCGVYKLEADNNSLQSGQNIFEAETPKKTSANV